MPELVKLTQQDKNEIKERLRDAEKHLQENDTFAIGFINALAMAQRLYLERLGLA